MFIVNKSKKIEDSEIIVPNIINGFDFSLSFFLGVLLDKDVFLSLLIIFEKGFFTLKTNSIAYGFIDLNKSL